MLLKNSKFDYYFIGGATNPPISLTEWVGHQCC